MTRILTSILFLISFLASTEAAFPGGGTIKGQVRDRSGVAVAAAMVTLLTAQQSVLRTVQTDAEGRFAFNDVVPGSYEVDAVGAGFWRARSAVQVGESGDAAVTLTLEPNPLTDTVTVTADVGRVQDKDEIGQQINIINPTRIQERAVEVVSQAVQEEVGVQAQRTSSVMGGVFIRGLTGRNVVMFVDGIRYTTSTQRGGVNTFLNLIEPSGLRGVEVLRGPNSSQYGSDSLGGSVQFVSQPAYFSSKGLETHGQTSFFGTSATAGFGNATRFTLGTRNFGLAVNLAARRINTLRPGGGFDSHAAVTRFLGLRSDIINGERLPDTAFTEYTGSVRMNYAFATGQQLIVHYQRGQQDGGKRYDQLLGGDGNNIADLRNLMMDFGYVRYDSQTFLGLDNFTATASLNRQREERVNQGGQGNPAGGITSQYERTLTNGFQAFGGKLLPYRNDVLVGADFYQDRIAAPAFTRNPVTNVVVASRPRIPNGARYRSYGFYAQDVWEAVPERLRISGSVRYGASSYRSRAEDAPVVNGRPLFPSDSLRADAVTFRTSAVVRITNEFSLTANFSRGFSAPNTTDLGTLGLQGNGFFEVSAAALQGFGGTIGSTAGAAAVSTGRPIAQVRPQTSLNYEAAAHYRNRRIDTDFGFFISDLDDIIVSQALILPPGAVGRTLADATITQQRPNGTVFVNNATNPVLVRSNFGKARIYGFEYSLDAKLAERWTLGGNFTYLRAKDKATGLPPNIEGGTPAPQGTLRLRYTGAGQRYWVELSTFAAYRQDRLSTLDLEDRRIGATRTRTQIRNFFLNGATFRGLVSPGADGRFGTADDVLRATGERVEQVQNRVLGTADSSPLFRSVAGFALLNLRGGFRIAENQDLLVAFENITDKNYRGISWGTDGPGRNLTIRYTVRF